ncbi:MAG: rhomboid family intramembrane serine protease [Armatimonadetes bacterium]|nr:rhomboid family intramembrane serine protease [Armatimonadota bacterium]
MSEPKSPTFVQDIKQWPLLTLGIIGLNIVVYLAIFRDITPGYPDIYPSRLYGLVPANLRVGKMLTSNFVHVSVGHLIVNMTVLYLFGRGVERAMGKLEFGLFYIGACFASSITHAAMVLAALPVYYADQPVVGASGAVAGVVGVYAVRYHRKVFNLFGAYIPALLVIAAWLITQLLLAIVGLYRDNLWGIGLKQVSYWSHLGGFGFGLLVALAGNMALKGEREHLIEEATRLYDNGSVLEATQRYESLIKCDPDNAFAHAELGRFWAILEEEDQSLPYYQMAIELYLSQGREAQALACSDEMRRFWPKAVVATPTRFRFASYLEESGYTKRAVRALRKLAEDEPDSIEAEMALLKIGQLQLSYHHDPAAALETAEGFLEKYPESEWRQFAEEVIDRAKS